MENTENTQVAQLREGEPVRGKTVPVRSLIRKGRHRRQKSVSRTIVYSTAFLLFALYTVLVLYFFVYGILISLKADQTQFLDDVLNCSLFSWPSPLNFGNYIQAFTEWTNIDGKNSFLMMLWNSVWRTTSSAFLTWFTTALVCYVLVHYKSKFTNFLYAIGLLISMLPLYGGQGAQYRLYSQLGLINSPAITLVSITLFGTYFFYMYAFWKGISHSYAEAASIDGANHYQILFRIMLPQVLPSIIALFVMQFISAWNDYESTAAYMTDYPNLAYGTYAYSEIASYQGNVPAYFAGVILTLIPVLILFIAFQNTIMEKVYFGGLKG